MTLSMTWPERRLLPRDEAEAVLSAHYAQAPGTVRLGLLVSADGKAAGSDGSSRSLNGPEDLRILRTLRHQADVVLVGGRTARSERYGDIRLPAGMQAARQDWGWRPAPDLAIVTRNGAAPASLDPARTWVITGAGTLTAHHESALAAPRQDSPRTIIAGESDLDFVVAIRSLLGQGMRRILCEGGPEVARHLLDQGLVDEYCLTHSPTRGGDDAPATPPVPPGWRLAHRLEGGGFTMERWIRPT